MISEVQAGQVGEWRSYGSDAATTKLARGNAIEVKFTENAPYLWAFDPEDGKLIAKIELPSNAQGGPTTYMAGGKQFIVIPIGEANRRAELVALRLP